MTDKLAHVIFGLEIVDGWPPVETERVWARKIDDDLYVVENVPWFVPGLSEGDTVRAVIEEGDKWPVAIEVVEWSGNYTVRFLPMGETKEQDILAMFQDLGATGELMGGDPTFMTALSIPSDADIKTIKGLIYVGAEQGRWQFEEARIDQAWVDA